MIGSKARGRFEFSSPTKHWEGHHDLVDGRSLVPIAGELRERERTRREARRRAWEARQRPGWLRRAAGWLRDILRRPDRAQARRPGPNSASDGGDPWEVVPADPMAGVFEALSNAQLVARRAGHRELADALHCLFLLDLTGKLGEMAPLVASVRSSLQSALGDDPGAVN